MDRDGVINEEVNYLSHPSQLKLIDGSKKALKILKKNDFKIIVVTNQSGVSRGYFTEERMYRINDSLNEKLDYMIDEFYCCTHLPEDNCFCRKPNTEIVLEVYCKYGFSAKDCFMIGDKNSDIMFGKNAQIGTNILVLTGYGSEEYKEGTCADYVCENLYDAVVNVICKQ